MGRHVALFAARGQCHRLRPRARGRGDGRVYAPSGRRRWSPWRPSTSASVAGSARASSKQHRGARRDRHPLRQRVLDARRAFAELRRQLAHMIQNELDLVYLRDLGAWPLLVAASSAHHQDRVRLRHSWCGLPGAGCHGADKGGVLSSPWRLAAAGAPHRVRANAFLPEIIRHRRPTPLQGPDGAGQRFAANRSAGWARRRGRAGGGLPASNDAWFVNGPASRSTEHVDSSRYRLPSAPRRQTRRHARPVQGRAIPLARLHTGQAGLLPREEPAASARSNAPVQVRFNETRRGNSMVRDEARFTSPPLRGDSSSEKSSTPGPYRVDDEHDLFLFGHRAPGPPLLKPVGELNSRSPIARSRFRSPAGPRDRH